MMIVNIKWFEIYCLLKQELLQHMVPYYLLYKQVNDKPPIPKI